MTTAEPTIDWILLADRGHARILSSAPFQRTTLEVIEEFKHTPWKTTGHVKYHDGAGRVDHPMGGRSAVQPHADPDHLEAGRFAGDLAAAIEQARQEKRFDRLFVAAPPMLLGLLRESWSHGVKQLIAGEAAHNWIRLPLDELKQRVEELRTAGVT